MKNRRFNRLQISIEKMRALDIDFSVCEVSDAMIRTQSIKEKLWKKVNRCTRKVGVGLRESHNLISFAMSVDSGCVYRLVYMYYVSVCVVHHVWACVLRCVGWECDPFVVLNFGFVLEHEQRAIKHIVWLWGLRTLAFGFIFTVDNIVCVYECV